MKVTYQATLSCKKTSKNGTAIGKEHTYTKKDDLRDLEKLQHIAVNLYLFDDGDLTQWGYRTATSIICIYMSFHI